MQERHTYKADSTFVKDVLSHTGEPVFAWCGPQPNSRLLLNYGIVDEQNPNDKMTITATIPNSDPLFAQKRQLLQHHDMASQQSFQLQRHHVSHNFLNVLNCHFLFMFSIVTSCHVFNLLNFLLLFDFFWLFCNFLSLVH